MSSIPQREIEDDDNVPYKLSLELQIRMVSPIESVISPTHDCIYSIKKTNAQVRLAKQVPLDSDFVSKFPNKCLH